MNVEDSQQRRFANHIQKIRGIEMGIEHFARHLDAFCNPSRGPVLIRTGQRKGYMYQFANALLEPLAIIVGQNGRVPDSDSVS